MSLSARVRLVRLGEDRDISIALIEYGGSDAGPFIQMPAALSYPMNMRLYDWGYRAVAEPTLNGRSLVCPRGKVIGGSSSINGMIYVRGHAGDYDHWQAQGASGWSYADILPYFKKMETALDGEAGWRGGDGPLHILPPTAHRQIFGIQLACIYRCLDVSKPHVLL